MPIGATVHRLAQVLKVTPDVFLSREPIGGLTLLPIRDAAVLLDVPSARVPKWIQTGILPGHKVGVHWRIPAFAIAELARSGRLRGASRRLAPRYRGSDA
jgi:excisionase family DNA binding protein